MGGDLTGDVNLIDRTDDAEVRIPNLRILGDIAGEVTIDTDSGGIGQVRVEGVVGESGDAVSIFSGRDITSIVSGEMFADIVAPRSDGGVDYWGNIRELRTSKLLGTNSGNFVGTIHAKSVGDPLGRSLELVDPPTGPQIEIQGDLGDGTTTTYLEFESPLTYGNPFENAQIVIGKAFRNYATIEVPAGGLEGKIILNRNNVAAPWQASATVLVGSTALTTTHYNVSAATIGGGAAGLAEFRLHHAACQPPDVFGDPPVNQPGVVVVPTDLVLAPDGFSWDCVPRKPSAAIQFYGPVRHSLWLRERSGEGPLLQRRLVGSRHLVVHVRRRRGRRR